MHGLCTQLLGSLAFAQRSRCISRAAVFYRGLATLKDSSNVGNQQPASTNPPVKGRRWIRGAAVVGGLSAGLLLWGIKRQMSRADVEPLVSRPKPVVQKKMHADPAYKGLKLTLYQYVTCPFCCKVRAYLDYYGIPYDVVEVNSISKNETKWSSYKKVPTICIEGIGEKGYLQINDSSVIVSLLHSHAIQGGSKDCSKLLEFYPTLKSKDGKKTVYDFPNKYFLMFEDKKAGATTSSLREEREWREWADEVLVHALSPNVYRTFSEAVQAFRVFGERGNWETVFSSAERVVVIYLGALAMWLLGNKLKRKYKLHDDARQSLYEYSNDWVDAIGPHRSFMGGDEPNMADLAVYGILSSIEGCQAFTDNMEHSKIAPWYNRMKALVTKCSGAGAKVLHLRNS